MAKDYSSYGKQIAAEDNIDMTQAKAGGGGDFTPPAAGFCLMRMVGYFEIGKQKGSFQGKPTVKDKVQIVFELSGPKHPPTVAEDGTQYPQRITIEETYSLSEKARFFKLFQRMNYAGGADHIIELMGQSFKGVVVHRKFKRRTDPADAAGWTGLAAELWDKKDGTWTIMPPRAEVQDENGMPTGEWRNLVVPPALTPLKDIVWNRATLEDWNSIHIDGEYPERKNDKGEVTAPAKSKNVIQNTIKSAVNFKGSHIYNLIAAAGGNLDIPDADVPEDEEGDAPDVAQKPATVEVPEGAAADDALNGIA